MKSSSRSLMVGSVVLLLVACFWGCGGGGGSSGPPPPPPSISVSPSPAFVASGGPQQFTSTVTNESNKAVTWQVNGVAGGSAATGTITTTGLYTAPASPMSVTVTAVS